MVLFLLSFQIIASGQVYSTDGTTATGIAPGSPSGAYALSSFESINLYNGNLNVALPLLGVNGRGHAAHTMMLGLNENHWRVRKTYDRMIDDYKYSPTQYWWKGSPGYGPGTLMGRQVAFESAPSSCVHDAFGNPKPWPQYTLTRLTFTTPDGTEYELRDQATNGQPLYRTGCFTGASRGTVFISADGTAMTFIADNPIVDYVGIAAQTIAPSGYLMLRDGTRYRIDNGAVTWIRDHNGNRITFTYPSNGLVVTDSLNRQVSVTYADLVNVFYDQITYRGFGGAPRTILINYAQLSSVLRAGYAIQTMAQLFPELNGSSSSFQNNPYVVSSVMLPNNMQYQLNYNSYGEVARVVLPTGGAVEYDMALGSGAVYGFTDWEIYRRLAERREYADGSTGSTYTSRTVYTATSSGPQAPRPWSTTVTVDHYNSGSTQVFARDKHYFNGSGLSSLFSSSLRDSRFDQYPAWTDGREYMTEAIDPSGSGTTVLRRVEETWRQRALVSWWTASADTAPPNDPRISQTVRTIEPGGANLVAQQTFGYDDTVPYNNRNDFREYDYGSGAPGALARETSTTYVTSANYTDAVAGAHLRSLPAQVSVFDSGGVERARTVSEYDNYAPDANHAGLMDRSGISGFDSSFSTSYPTRGNATAATHFLLTNGSVTGSITTYVQYDIAGNLVKAIDARGYATTLDFSDRFGAPDGEARSNSGAAELGAQYTYAFPTLVTNALGHTAYAQFDYYLGRLVDGEDANGVVASGYYNDALDRPTQVIRAANQGTSVKSQSTFSYDDQNHVITTTSDQNSFNDTNPLKSQVVYDNLGRTTEKRQYETANDYISVRQAYDSLGRSYQTSNPFRAGDTILWTTTGYDALSRVISITTPDNAVITTSYNGNTVTVTDQTGKQRKSVSDGLGRLAQVYEDPSGLNYGTSYTYDVIDNLLTVTQGTQPPRSFIYDSLKRLGSATNPESGRVDYQYDENGNTKVKTDARGVSAHFSYDALNRVTRRWYNGSTSLDQVNNNVPTLPSGVAASDEVSYFYDSQSLPPGAPPGFSPGYSIGRLVATVYSTASSSGDYHGYDAAGRPVLKIQQTGGVNYPVSAIYNLAGAITTEGYPSGRTVTYGYDGAGRTNSTAGNLGDGNPRSYSTGIIYSPFGGLAKEQFGTAIPVYNKLFYNSRGQLAEIREITSYTGPTDTNWNRGAIINDYSNNCGGLCSGQSMTDNNGNLKKQENYVPDNDQISTYSTFTAAFTYDSLNRLQAANESKYLNGSPNGTPTYSQSYTIDRWGNRTISQATGGLNGLPFNVDPSTNRLTPPSGYTMTYDSAGNLTNDTYTGQGQRNYDAENRMTQAWASGQWQSYTYDGNGQRVRRNAYGTETWQVYGLGGELLGEYRANGAASTPQKEYGYRNGQMLIIATAPSGLAANKPSDTKTEAVAAALPASATGTAAAAQSFDLLASIKGLVLRSSGIKNGTTASTEAVSDTSTSLYGPAFPYSSLSHTALPLMLQSGSPKIAFASNGDGSAQICSMNTDGSGLSRLTNDVANDEAPNWSPNNSRIVFQSDRDNLFSGIADIYVMNWDGSGQTRLTSDPADDSAPVWSPDGTKIAFQSARNGVSYQVFVMNADGSGQVNISNSTANDTQPSWSPDGSKIAFASDRDQAGFSSIYVMNANGTNQTRLTISGIGLLDQQPTWSPDGSKLTFTSTRDSTLVTWTETDDNGGIVTKSALQVNKEVYVMNANGSAQVRLTTTLENDDSASWSGDGTKIVFRSDRERDCCDPTEQVWVMNPDGTNQVDLSNNGLDEHCPSWQHFASNVPPTVSLTSPANGATFIAPANITLTANASDSDGSVSRVDFYQGLTLIGTATTSPYTVTWNNVAAGSYSLTARATDNLGANTASASVNITVNAPPSVSITTPSNGATFTAPANITITANASDSDGSISGVDFYQGTTLVGTATTSPYTISWNNVTAGGYTLTARATDNLGASSTSSPVSISVGSPPTVSVTTPTNGASFTAPANVTVTANASSSTGSISRVEFYQGTTLIGTASTSPYTISWNNVAAGSWTLKARAIDNSNVSTDSTPVNISVNGPPTVSLTSPTNGASFNALANITITANANDSDGTVSRVDFYQGTSLIGTATASPYNIIWNNVTTGTYSLTAKATDNLGTQTISTAVNVTVITTVADIRWIVTDQLGTPRMIFDQTGSLANVSRHDYLPFGEEVLAGRPSSMGYTGSDNARQKFTGYEADLETGLNFAQARYQSNTQGRFTSADSVTGSPSNPQTLNLYSYVQNNPLTYTDPTGHYADHGMFGALSGSFSDIPWTVAGGDQEVSSPDSCPSGACFEEANTWEDHLSSGVLQVPQNAAIIFDKVELLDDPGAGYSDGHLRTRPEISMATATKVENAPMPNSYSLDLDSEKVDAYSVLAIRVTFHTAKGFETDPSLVSVSPAREGTKRYELLEEYLPGTGRKATQPDYGQVIFRVKATGLDAGLRAPDIVVTVGAVKNLKFIDLNNRNSKPINYEKLYLRLQKIN